MRRPVLKITSSVLCAAAIVAVSASRGEAGLFGRCCSLFGWHHGAHSAGFGPTYTTAGYAPLASPWSTSYLGFGATPTYTSYAPLAYGAGACCPTTTFSPVACCPTVCDPCGVVCGPAGCPGGACPYDVAPPASGPLSPQPDGTAGPPPTYLEDPSMGPSPATPPADEGFQRRSPQQEQQEDVFGPSGTAPAEGSVEPRASLRPNDPVFKAPESVIPQRRPAPGNLPAEGTSGSGGTDGSLHLPPLGLDNRITWRTPPERTRLLVEASFTAPVVARTKLNPNSGWIPVTADARLARK